MRKLFAVGDTHGDLFQLLAALTQAKIINENREWIAGDSILVFTGDYIDRGPYSAQLIDWLIKLQKNAIAASGMVEFVEGNHERMLIDSIKEVGWYRCWLRNGGRETLQSYAGPAAFKIDYHDQMNVWYAYLRHKDFYDNLKSYVIIDDIMFVHAGVDPESNLDNIENNHIAHGEKSHLWIRNEFWGLGHADFLEYYKCKKIVFGHTPTKYITKDNKSLMQPVSLYDGKLLCIDTGSYYENGCVTVVGFNENLSHFIAGCSK